MTQGQPGSQGQQGAQQDQQPSQGETSGSGTDGGIPEWAMQSEQVRDAPPGETRETRQADPA
jgi:hypothetical protein